MMTTSSQVQHPESLEMSPQPFIASPPTYNANISGGPIGDADVRSSSLSEIEDGGGNAHSPSAQAEQGIEGGDTEAETERLEESPHKPRKHQNIVLTASLEDQKQGDNMLNEMAAVREELVHGTCKLLLIQNGARAADVPET